MPADMSSDEFERATALAIAADEDVDYRSVLKRMHGIAVKGPSGRRIERALVERGILASAGEKTVGQVAYEAMKLRFGWSDKWDDISAGVKSGWEFVAQAVVEEHERRKR